MTLYLLNFKNYYDRKGTRYLTIEDYENNSTVLDIVDDIDFNPNDGIWASQIVNTFYGNADYLLVVDGSRIINRWYILESTRTRSEQYQLKLLRDVVADYWDTVVGAPTFIEKATVNYGNPLLFNSENMTFNQIKTSEKLLRDRSCCPWIVGYIKSDTEAVSVTVPTQNKYYEEYASIEDIPFYNYVRNGTFRGNLEGTDLGIYYLWQVGIFAQDISEVTFSADNYNYYKLTQGPFSSRYNSLQRANKYATGYTQSEVAAGAARSYKTYYLNNQVSINDHIRSEFNIATKEQTSNFLNTYSTEGKIFKVGSSYYKVSRSAGRPSTLDETPTSTSSAVYNDFISIINSSDYVVKTKEFPDTENFRVRGNFTAYNITITEVKNAENYQVSIPGPSNRAHLKDAPYDLFAIPYPIDHPRMQVSDDNGLIVNGVKADASMAIATGISKALGDRLLDLQLLPYCPIQDTVRGAGSVYLSNENYGSSDYTKIEETTGGITNVSIILWATSSTFSLKIDTEWQPQATGGVLGRPLDIIIKEPKIESECDMYRLSSPNYSSQFEFNAARNYGVEWFNVDCTYKPYSPYIRVAPNFKGLYGSEFDDARGLILGGDFSLATITDAWQQYQVNNKNYLNAFDRQIENLEVQQKYQRQAEIVGAVVGTVSGAAGGAGAGLMLGGGYGAAAGGTIGALASGVAGAVDISINDKLRNEALDYTRDQFGFALGNIRALPYTLNRVSAFNINNKYFPVLEYYTCTDVEKEALRNKIRYNGMTVGTVGTIAEYLQEEETYIKGRIIRLGDIHEDYHLASAVAEEIYKGVFV